jgi:hypothetical protein
MEPLAKYKVSGYGPTETSAGDKLSYWVNSVRNWRAWVALDTLKGVPGGWEIYDVFEDIPLILPPALDIAATEQKGFHRNVARTLC